ncbi:MAG: hypothetical protein IBX63_09830 [Coriobacteriia bacterium]|nr:hypothetical protein [Coriobacteriia bacterium]
MIGPPRCHLKRSSYLSRVRWLSGMTVIVPGGLLRHEEVIAVLGALADRGAY